MVSLQILSEDIVLRAQSCYNENCLILEQVRLMDKQSLISLCEILKDYQRQRLTGEALLSGKPIASKKIVCFFIYLMILQFWR